MRLLRSTGMPWKKNGRRAISAVLAMAMVISGTALGLALSAAGILEAPKLKADGKHKIVLETLSENNNGIFIGSSRDETGTSSSVGGTISADKTEAEAGETVTVTVTLKAGFELDSMVYGDGLGDGVHPTQVDETTYTFVMQDREIIVDAYFSATSFVPYVVYFNYWNNGLATVTGKPMVLSDSDAAANFVLPDEDPEVGHAGDREFLGWETDEGKFYKAGEN